MTTVLRYTGDDEGPFIMGVPARNLTDDDLTALVGNLGNNRGAVKRALVKSGMYAEAAKTADKPKTTEAASEPAAPDKADKEAS